MSENLEGFLAVLPCAALLERAGVVVARNAAARALLGEAPEAADAASSKAEELFVGEYPFNLAENLAGKDVGFDCAVLRRDGALLPVRGALRVIEGAAGPLRLITLTPLEPGETTFVGALLEAAPEALALTRAGRAVYVNREFTRMFGYSNSECLGKALDELLTPADERPHAQAMYVEVRQAGRAAVETVRCSRGGDCIDVSLLVGQVEMGAGEPGLLHTFRDIRERKRAEAELEFRALHDTMTGLANRALLQDRLQQGLKRMRREPEHAFAVLFLDLDGFKATNDTLGHEAGDQLLLRVAKALRECVRPQDTVARVGGDEFALLLESAGAAETARLVADRVLRAVAGAALSEKLPLSASIGIVMVNEPNGTADRILRQADIAMYHAKAAGKARSMLYAPGMSMSRRGVGPMSRT